MAVAELNNWDINTNGLLKCLVLLLQATEPGNGLSVSEAVESMKKFVPPMRSAHFRRFRRSASALLLSHSGKVWREAMGPGEVPGIAVCSRHFARTLLLSIKNSPTSVKLAVTHEMLNAGLSRWNVEPGQPLPMTGMLLQDGHDCAPVAFFNEVLHSVFRTSANQLKVHLLQDVIRLKNTIRGDDEDEDSENDGEDPTEYAAIDKASVFCRDLGEGLDGGGNKSSDVTIRNRYMFLCAQFFIKYRGPIPDAASITTADQASRYLKPWLHPGFRNSAASSSEEEEESEASDTEQEDGDRNKAPRPRARRDAEDEPENSEESDYVYESMDEEEGPEDSEAEDVLETKAVMDVTSDFSDYA